MVEPKYCVNTKTKKVHLANGCNYSNNQNCKKVHTIEEAKAQFGDGLTFCQFCKLKDSDFAKGF